jgi:carboxymethylenebutenolidase
MCFDLDSLPPVPVVAGAAVSHESLTLQSDVPFAAFLATPERDVRESVVILPDVRGLYRFYEELALRFAERGIAAIAIDYFGRTAGAEPRGDDFEYGPHVDQTTDAGVQADTRAAVEELRGRGATAVFTVGFCFGGRASWIAAASGHGLAGAVGFYGNPTRERGGPSAVARAPEMACPILALQGGADASITADDNNAFDAALAAAGVEHEIVTYPGAPHSFFDRKQEEFADASADAWRRVLDFVENGEALTQ